MANESLPSATATTAAASVPTISSTARLWRCWASIACHLNSELSAVKHASIHGFKRIFSITFIIKPTHICRNQLQQKYRKAYYGNSNSNTPVILISWHFLIFSIPHKCKTTTFSGVSISGDINVTNFATTFENTTQIVWSSSISEVIDLKRKKIIHTINFIHFDIFLDCDLEKKSYNNWHECF